LQCYFCYQRRDLILIILPTHHFILFWKGIDYIGYATGQTDKFQGTGVFSGIKMERNPSPPVAETKAESKPTDGKETADTAGVSNTK
jgi:hypothetical protein